MADNHDYQVKKWEAYIARKKVLEAAGLVIAERYLVWLVSIAGGSLGISLTFLEKIAPHPRGETKFLLATSWFFLGVSVLGAFVGNYLSGQALRRQIEITEYNHKVYRKQQDPTLPEVLPEDTANLYSKIIPFLDFAAVLSLIAGLFFLCLFSFFNLPKEAELGSKPLAAEPPKRRTEDWRREHRHHYKHEDRYYRERKSEQK